MLELQSKLTTQESKIREEYAKVLTVNLKPFLKTCQKQIRKHKTALQSRIAAFQEELALKNSRVSALETQLQEALQQLAELTTEYQKNLQEQHLSQPHQSSFADGQAGKEQHVSTSISAHQLQ